MPKEFKHSRILVIGDIMLDKYWFGNTERTSPEAPVPIVHVQKETYRVGGAANVAINMRALHAQPTLLGLVGQDHAAETIKSQLNEKDVNYGVLSCGTHPTITKLRVISQRQQMLRMDFEDKWERFDKDLLLASYKKALKESDLVVLSDYAKGTLFDCQALIEAAKELNVPVLVDPKGRDFTRYRGATLIKPNLSELEAVVGPCPDDNTLVEKGMQLLSELDLQALLVTRGGDGMTLLQKNEQPFFLPATSSDLVDVTGAGDTVIATLATALASGYKYTAAVHLANLAAGIVVSKLGTSEVTNEELTAAYQKHQPLSKGVVTREELAKAVKEAQAEGETVVMTNGCFDLLHIGHVTYLQKAKQLGDRLIVAINDDESIRRLKGEGRPVSPLASRAAVLAALEAVDWVVPFHEDTPEPLLELLQPDILVKGTDYQIDEIVGAPIVLGYGGEVKRVAHDHQDISTSQLIAKTKS